MAGGISLTYFYLVFAMTVNTSAQDGCNNEEEASSFFSKLGEKISESFDTATLAALDVNGDGIIDINISRPPGL